MYLFSVAQLVAESLDGPRDIWWLPWSAIVTTALIVGTVGFWSTRFLPFTGRERPPRYLVVWTILLAALVAAPGVLQLAAETVSPWWALWVAGLLAAVCTLSVWAFQRARGCYPEWVNGCLLALLVISFSTVFLWWFLELVWFLLLLLLLLLLYILWLASVMLVCASKPPPNDGLAPPEEQGGCPDIVVGVHASDTKTHSIPSKLPASRDPKPHFVTVNGTGNIILVATVTPDADVTWTARGGTITSPGVGTDRKTARISRANPRGAKITVEIKVGNRVCKEVVVWIVWATLAARRAGQSTLFPAETLGLGSVNNAIFYKPAAGIEWTATILPAAIITDADRPAIDDQRKAAPPGSAGGLADSGPPPASADHTGSGFSGWDMSRQVRKKVTKGNPTHAPPEPMAVAGANDPVSMHRPRSYPTNDVLGNDDRSPGDEDDNPYAQQVGTMRSWDEPGLGQRHAVDYNDVGGGEIGDTIHIKMHFREFARVQLQRTWYRCSDWGLWRVHHNLKFAAGGWAADGAARDRLEEDNADW